MKDSMKEIMDNNPNCQGVIIPKIGHGIPLANPKLFNKMLEEWLDSNLIIDEVKLVSNSWNFSSLVPSWLHDFNLYIPTIEFPTY